MGCPPSVEVDAEPFGRRLEQCLPQTLMLEALHRLADKGLDQQGAGLVLGNAAGPEVEPWPHTTSSAKISSSGFESNSAVSESSSACATCLPSVFCAPGETIILPWNTPRASLSSTALNSSRLTQRGTRCSTSSVVSQC